jgi:Na+-transporting methylmalonyl-CoA/oxaloacetate decarboxylase gamma subunit
MTISQSLLVGLFCMTVVFCVLAMIFVIIRIFSALIGIFAKKQVQPASLPAQISEAQLSNFAEENDVFSSGMLKLKDVEEQTAAMIMAIVSDESGIPLSELCFKSIRLVK